MIQNGNAKPHCRIDRALFEVSICPGEAGEALEQGLVGLLRGRVMPVLERVLEGFPWPEGPVTVPRLVVDLGDLAVDRAEELLPQRFEAALGRALKGHLDGLRVDPGAPDGSPRGPRPGVRVTGGDFRRALKTVLAEGRTGEALLRVMDGWGDHHGEVRRFFETLGGDRLVPRHAAASLHRHQLLESATFISPAHGAFVGGFVLTTVSRRRLLLERAPMPGDADGFERQLWEFTLAFLLGKGRGGGDRKGYLRHVVFAMAARQNMKKAVLLNAFGAVFSRSEDALSLEVSRLLAGISLELEGERGASARRKTLVEGSRSAFGETVLRVFYGQGTSADLENVRRGLKQERALVADLVKRAGRRAEVRANMVASFSCDELETVVSALGPEGAAVGRFVARSVVHADAMQGHAPEVTGRGVFSDLLWELSLALLLEERQGRFNFKSYLTHLIAGMAARYNMAYGTLLKAFCRTYKNGDGQRDRESRRLLKELWTDEEKRRETGPAEGVAGDAPSGVAPWPEKSGRAVMTRRAAAPAARDVTEPRGADDVARGRVHRLWTLLAGSRVPHGEALRELLQSVRKESPVLFMRWARELQDRPDRVRVMVAALDRGALTAVLYEALAVLTMAPEESVRQMVRSALAAGDKGGKAETAEAVVGLLRGMPGGLATAPASPETSAAEDGGGAEAHLVAWMEALKQEGSEEAAAMVSTLKARGTGETARAAEALLASYRRFVREGADPEPCLERLARLLDGSEPPGFSVQALCAWDVQRALAGNASGLREVLVSRLRSWNGSRRLAEGLPESDAARVLGLLAPSWGSTVLPILDALLLGIASAGRASDLWRWKHLILAWTFQLAATRSGMSMAPGPFLDTLLAWLVRHGGRGVVGDLFLMVSANIRPETEDVLLPVVEAMHGWLNGGRAAEAAGLPMAPEKLILTGEGASAEEPIDEFASMASAGFEPAVRSEPVGRQDIAGEESMEEACRIENAGLVILSPYLPALFSRLGYLESGRFPGKTQGDRAALLLNFLSHTTQETPEYPMTFNRLLCGTASEGRHLEKMALDEKETALAEEMLRAVVANWQALKNTTPEGLREAFLARQGQLRRKEGAWHLDVMPKAWDVLLDRLPWGLTPIRHPWMEQVLYVNWR